MTDGASGGAVTRPPVRLLGDRLGQRMGWQWSLTLHLFRVRAVSGVRDGVCSALF